MLKLKEFIAVLEFAQSIEPRRFGHFDHEANLSEGPSPSLAEEFNYGMKVTTQRAPVVRAQYEAFEDLETGEILYRVVEPE